MEYLNSSTAMPVLSPDEQKRICFIHTWLPVVLITAGAVLRIEYLREYSAFVNFDIPAGPDVMEYDLRAREILKGSLFPAVPDIHAPLYPMFLSLLYYLGNFSIVPARIVQLLLNFISWLFFDKLLKRQGTSFSLRMISLACAMLYPVAFFHQAEIISESLLLPFLVAVLWFTELAETSFSKRKQLIFMTMAGVAAGLAAITHPLTLSFTAAVFAWKLWKKVYYEALFFLAGTMLVILPVTGIKTYHYGKLTGIQQNGGFNFWLGNNPDATGGCYLRPGPVWRTLHKGAKLEAEQRKITQDRVWLERSAKFWIEQPLDALRLYLNKAVMVCSPAELISGADPGALVYRTPVVRTGAFMLVFMMFFALYGAICAIRRKERNSVMFFLLGGALYAAQILTVTSGRYRLAMMPALLYFTAYGAADFPWKKYFYLPGLAGVLLLPFTWAGFTADIHEAAAIRGEAAMRKGKSQDALKLLGFAKTKCFDPARIANQIGMIKEKNGDFSGALKEYREAASGDPDAMESWMNLANLHARFPRYRQAAEHYYRQALDRAPNSAVLRYNHAVFLKNTARKKAAEKELLLALKFNNMYAPAYNLLGIILLESGNRQAAEKCFQAAAESDPSDPGYRRNLEIVRNGIRSSANK